MVISQLIIVAYNDTKGLFLSQSPYVYNQLRYTNMLEAKPVSSSMFSSQNLSLYLGALYLENSNYHSVLGTLQYW